MAASPDAEASADRNITTPEQFYRQAHEAQTELQRIWREAEAQHRRVARRAARWAAAKWLLIWAVTAMPLSAAAGYGLHLLGPTATAFSGVVGLIIGVGGGVVCMGRYDREGRW